MFPSLKKPCLTTLPRRHVPPSLADKSVTFVITATAGLSGGIFRLPNSFIVPLVGGRNVVYFTSLLLAIPCAWAAIALSSPDVSALMVVIAAMFSGGQGARAWR